MNEDKLLHLKNSLEIIMGISSWQPTYLQLDKIQIALIESSETLDARNISKIVHRIYDKPIELLILKGLNTGAAMAALLKVQELNSELKKEKEYHDKKTK